MNSFVHFVILSLAVWRVGRMLASPDESGPWDMAHKARFLAGAYYNERSELVADNWFGKMVICIYCNSVWLGALVTVSYAISPVVALNLSLPFALSGAALIYNR